MDVLLIDDDEHTTSLIGMLFESSDVVSNFYIKNKAIEALEFLKSTHPGPDCIFVDLKMPVMDGFEFIDEYNKQVKEGLIPSGAQVFVLSSTARPSDRDKVLGYASVREFILKPLTNQKIGEINEQLAKAE